MSAEQKRRYITEALEEVSSDIVELILRIILEAQSGIE